MKQKPTLLTPLAIEASPLSGRPKETFTDRARSFHSFSLQNLLTEIDNDSARQTDPHL
jgi:hypothetical protein